LAGIGHASLGLDMNWFNYLWEKIPELRNLGNKDFQLSKLVARIHRTRNEVVNIQVAISQIQPIHKIDRDTAVLRLNERIDALKPCRAAWLKEPFISNDLLHEVLPSVSAIKVIEIDHGQYVAFEGNGRLYAIKEVFDQLDVEVDLYVLEKDSKISRRVVRILKLNQLKAE